MSATELKEVVPVEKSEAEKEKNEKSSEDQQHHDGEEEEEEADCLHSKIGYSIKELILVCLWFILLGLYIWYLVEVSITLHEEINNPTTSISLVEKIPADLPQVTVCNWNSFYACGEKCNLTLVDCSEVDSEGTPIPCVHHPRFIQYEQNGNTFYCYQYNYEVASPVQVSSTGYEGSVSLYFNFPTMPELETDRNGLQVTFNKIGSEPDVLDETNYAFENVDNFYVLTHVKLETLANYDNHQPEYWDISYSRIGTSMGNVTVVSFCYSTLNINDIKEVETVTGIEIFAKVCEMLLILVVSSELFISLVTISKGIDFIKVIRGILLIPDAIRHKEFKEIFENFI